MKSNTSAIIGSQFLQVIVLRKGRFLSKVAYDSTTVIGGKEYDIRKVRLVLNRNLFEHADGTPSDKEQ